MKAKIYNPNNQKNYVTIEFKNEYSSEMGRINLMVPTSGGYVKFTNGGQVCEGLISRGNTLKFGPVDGDNFINFIRKQWKIYRRVMMA
jgi:hypothetical protein